jgi:hypothetical protein
MPTRASGPRARLVPLTRFALAAIAATALAFLSACGGDGDDGNQETAEQFGPLGTFTGSDSGCVVSTNGFVAEPGTMLLRFANEHDAVLTIELLDSSGETVASAEDLEAGDVVNEEFDLEAGDYTTSCTDSTLTWTNDGGGETPSGVILSSPAFTVGSG